VLGLDRRVLELLGGLLGGAQNLLRAFGESVKSHTELPFTTLEVGLTYAPMLWHSVRWRLAYGAATSMVVLVGVLLQVNSALAPGGQALAGTPARGVAADARHLPWYHLSLLHQTIRFTEPTQPAADAPAIEAAAGILVDIDTGQVLWELNDHQARPPASTVKTLTALVVMQNFAASTLITAQPDALTQAGDETKMGLRPGDRMTVEQLLSGMLLASGNDAATVLAGETVGAERFVGAMNAQLAALGLHDSHVTSPVGLDDRDMYASAYDLAVVATADVLNFPLFRAIVDTKSETIPATADHQAFLLNNVNQLLELYPAAVGIKPGWTGDAGACEVGMAVRDGHRLVSVLLDGHLVYTETKRLLDWGFVHEGLPSLLTPPVPAVNH
jgi:D-alanyl-D-alanine carboxypeptidase (penicillin-binding protein 5/6)